ncbi:Lipoprotein OS=Streptomyces tendae OX=1932 GN=F3L20_07610 PE=4 SV=1 [Streptomyces tendae]
MSPSPSPRLPLGPRRRSLLASAAGAALLVGCTGDPGTGDTGIDPSAAERVRARAARDSEDLAGRYAAVMAAHPGLAERLGPLREAVVRHAEAFGGVRGASPEVSGTAVSPEVSGTAVSPSGSARAAGPGDAGGVPADEKGALALLADAERKLADRRAGALLSVPGESARLLASVAAAGAAHVFLLTEGGR